MQVWPALTNLPQINLLAVSLISVFLSIMHGFLPPNSNVNGVKNLEAALATILPTFTLPVKNM